MNENDCKTLKNICSRGIPNNCDIYINGIRTMDNLSYENFTSGVIIFIKIDFFHLFSTKYIHRINKPFVLVSGNSDYTLPDDFFRSEKDFQVFIDNIPLLIHWFAQNCIATHPKLSQIPIGLDYHTLTQQNNTGWSNTILSCEQQEQILEKIKSEALPTMERSICCYSNFQFLIHTRYGYDRKNAIKNIPSNIIFYEKYKTDRETSWKRQTEFMFVVCPHGNGFDTHRLWEALILGCFPIVKTSGLDELYNGLPVLIVNEWEDLSKELLQTTMNDFKNKHFSLEKLTLNYWINLIRSSK